jgi:hypothetical protein
MTIDKSHKTLEKHRREKEKAGKRLLVTIVLTGDGFEFSPDFYTTLEG